MIAAVAEAAAPHQLALLVDSRVMFVGVRSSASILALHAASIPARCPVTGSTKVPPAVPACAAAVNSFAPRIWG